MIKICHLVDQMRIGGLENTILEIALNLNDNYEHHVWCMIHRGMIADELERHQIPLKVLNISGGLRPSSVAKLTRELKQGGFDILHAHGAYPGVWGALAGRLAQVRHRIVHCQSTFYDAGLYFLSKLILFKGCAQHYIAASEAVKKSLMRCAAIPASKISVIYNSAAPRPHSSAQEKLDRRAALGIQPDDFVIGSISRIEAHKGHRYLLEAIASLYPAQPRLKCLIVGDGEALGDLRSFTRDRGLEKVIYFTGWQKDINSFLSIMDVFVQPSTLREGLPLSLAEAASASLPMIATDIGGNPEIVAHDINGYIVPAKDAPALAAKIGYLLEHPQECTRLGENALKTWQEKFTLAAMLHKIDTLYQSLYLRNHE